MLYVRCTQHTEYILSLSADKTTHMCSLFIYLVLGTWSQDTGVFCNQKRMSTGNCVCHTCCFNGGLWYVRVQHLCLSHHLPVFKTPAVLSLQNITQCLSVFYEGSVIIIIPYNEGEIYLMNPVVIFYHKICRKNEENMFCLKKMHTSHWEKSPFLLL